VTDAPGIVVIAAAVADAMIDHARDEAPRESCGMLASDASGVIAASFPVANVSPHATRAFVLDPPGELAAFEAIDGAGLDFAGVYHSHPRGGARPSGSDIAGGGAIEGVTVIVALTGDGQAALLAYSVASGAVRELELRVAG
jgi:[CysO sulfur-carrier protein]-S-L-cysteine hydrolase